MQPSPIVIVATTTALPGQGEALRVVFEDLARGSRTEDGCLSYGLHVERDDGDVFVFVGAWRDHVAWQAHMEGETWRRAQERAAGLIGDTVLHRLDAITV